MLGAVFQIMWLRLWRDRGALILAFVLPGFIFAIFASIFSNASGGNLDLRVSMGLTSSAPASTQFAELMIGSGAFSVSFDKKWTESDIRERVRLGQDDVGFVITGDLSTPGKAPIVIFEDPSRSVASTVLMGQIRQTLAEQSHLDTAELFTRRSALPAAGSGVASGAADLSVTYYIGATAILFLLFSAMQGAAITLGERQSGISDRLLIGPVGAAGLLSGKFVFLTLIGALQAAIITGVAAVFFNVAIVDHLPALVLACFGAAALAAGLALLTASLCRTAPQMNAVSTFIVLLFSAVGGSMVPRFMMPDWLQSLGRFTPNHWAIEGFYGSLARGQSVTDLAPVWAVLFGGALTSLLLSVLISHRLMRV